MDRDLLAVFLLTPLWWILGFNIFIYQLTAGLVFLKLIIAGVRREKNLSLPKATMLLGFFLLSFLFSILINISEYPAQRIFASLNNYSMFLMGVLLIGIVYNGVREDFLAGLFGAGFTLAWLTGGIAVIFLIFYFTTRTTLEVTSLLARIFPSLVESPFFYLMLSLRTAAPDWIVGNIPRVSIYSHAHIATGDFMVILIPLMIGYRHLQKKEILPYAAALLAALTALAFSLSRTALCSFVAAFIFVNLIEKNKTLIFSLASLLACFFTSGLLYSGVEWLINLRIASNVGRMNIYAGAVDAVFNENILFGLGVRPREGFTMMALGSHSTYMGILLSAGMIGVLLFVMFQVSVFVNWYQQKKRLITPQQKIFWKYLGMSYIGANMTFVTSGLDALPFVAYAYFLITGSILLLSKTLKQQALTSFS